VDHSDIKTLANLARINIDETMVDEVTGSINTILDLMNQLQAADTNGVEPMAHPLDAVQRLRPDEITEENQRDALQTTASITENGLYLVPQVIE